MPHELTEAKIHEEAAKLLRELAELEQDDTGDDDTPTVKSHLASAPDKLETQEDTEAKHDGVRPQEGEEHTGWITPGGNFISVRGHGSHAGALIGRTHLTTAALKGSTHNAVKELGYTRLVGTGTRRGRVLHAETHKDNLPKVRSWLQKHADTTQYGSAVITTFGHEDQKPKEHEVPLLKSFPEEIDGVLIKGTDVEDTHKTLVESKYEDHTARLVHADALEEAGRHHLAAVHRVIATREGPESAVEYSKRLHELDSYPDKQEHHANAVEYTHRAYSASRKADRASQGLENSEQSRHLSSSAMEHAEISRDYTQHPNNSQYAANRHRNARNFHQHAANMHLKHAESSPDWRDSHLEAAQLHTAAAEAHNVAFTSHLSVERTHDDSEPQTKSVEVKALSLSAPRPFKGPAGEAMQEHDYHDDEGKKLGVIRLHPRNDGKTLHVHWVGPENASTGEQAHSVGAGEMKSMLPEIRKHYPDAEFITGHRAGGFRSGTGGSRVMLPLKKKGDE